MKEVLEKRQHSNILAYRCERIFWIFIDPIKFLKTLPASKVWITTNYFRTRCPQLLKRGMCDMWVEPVPTSHLCLIYPSEKPSNSHTLFIFLGLLSNLSQIQETGWQKYKWCPNISAAVRHRKTWWCNIEEGMRASLQAAETGGRAGESEILNPASPAYDHDCQGRQEESIFCLGASIFLWSLIESGRYVLIFRIKKGFMHLSYIKKWWGAINV